VGANKPVDGVFGLDIPWVCVPGVLGRDGVEGAVLRTVRVARAVEAFEVAD
jgi:hypothetical protein